MNESKQPQSVWPTDTEPHAATPADALHTLLEFVIDHKGGFKLWLNRRLREVGSSLVLNDEDIREALVDLDDLLHAAMNRPRGSAKVVKVPPEILRMVMERMASLTDEEVYGTDTDAITTVKDEDPDRGTGMYL